MLVLPQNKNWGIDKIPDGPIELDYSMPYISYLDSAYFFHDKRDGWDLVRKNQATKNQTPDLVPSEHGWVADFPDSADYFNTGFSPTDTSFTYFIMFRADDDPDSGPNSSGYGGPFSHSTRGILSWHYTGNDPVIWLKAGAWHKLDLGTGLVAGQWYCVAWSRESTNWRGYVNGDLVDTEVRSLESPTSNVYIGYDYNDSDDWDGQVAVVLYWGGIALDQEDPVFFDQVCENPFILLRQQPVWIPGLPPAGGTVHEGGISIAISSGISDVSDIITDQSVTIAKSLGIADQADISAEAALELANSVGLSNASSAIFEAATTYGLTTDLSCIVTIITDQSISLSQSHTLTLVGGLDIAAAVSMALSTAMATQSIISIEGAISLNASATMAAQCVAEFVGDINLDQVLALSDSVLADLNAQIALDTTESITSSGQLITDSGVTIALTATMSQEGAIVQSGQIVTPDSRIMAISFDDRTFSISVDDRTYPIGS